MQQALAALWDAAGTLSTDAHAAQRINHLVDTITEAEAQLAGLRLHLLHEATVSAADAVIRQARESVRTTTGQATAALRLAADLGNRFPLIADALNNGSLSLAQADAIVAGLRTLPTSYTRHDMTRCQQEILRFVDELDPAGLRTIAARLTELIDPDTAERQEAKRLEREERDAHRARYFRMSPDHHGSMRLSGQLPVENAALLAAQLEALMPAASTYAHTGENPSRDARRADALILLTHTAANSGDLPRHGSDRPHVHITLDHNTLTTGLGHTTVLDIPGIHTLPAGAARRLACDAHLIPMVLGTHSQPLDVGRAARYFTEPIRAALVERDKGCAFPGCDATPTVCHTHHIIPWWNQGTTTLDNGLLVCPHHHRLVEPDPQQSPDNQWIVHLDATTGLPWFTPPRHIDPDRKPIQHQRHALGHIQRAIRAHGTEAPPCPPVADVGAAARPPAEDPPQTPADRRPRATDHLAPLCPQPATPTTRPAAFGTAPESRPSIRDASARYARWAATQCAPNPWLTEDPSST